MLSKNFLVKTFASIPPYSRIYTYTMLSKIFFCLYTVSHPCQETCKPINQNVYNVYQEFPCQNNCRSTVIHPCQVTCKPIKCLPRMSISKCLHQYCHTSLPGNLQAYKPEFIQCFLISLSTHLPLHLAKIVIGHLEHSKLWLK